MKQLTADWVSPKEAASYLSVSKQKILGWIRDGQLMATRLGSRTIRISASSIEKMMARASTTKK
jgi:excisionase family DNA binding protein